MKVCSAYCGLIAIAGLGIVASRTDLPSAIPFSMAFDRLRAAVINRIADEFNVVDIFRSLKLIMDELKNECRPRSTHANHPEYLRIKVKRKQVRALDLCI